MCHTTTRPTRRANPGLISALQKAVGARIPLTSLTGCPLEKT